MAGVLEYLVDEVTEVAGDAARSNRKKRIQPHHINLSVQQDPELAKIFGHVVIRSGGVVPNIHPALLPMATDKKKVEKAPTVKPANEPGTSGSGGTTNDAGPSHQNSNSKKTNIPKLTGGKKRKNQDEP